MGRRIAPPVTTLASSTAFFAGHANEGKSHHGPLDLLLQNTNGAMMLWEMNGTQLPNPGASWQCVSGHPFCRDRANAWRFLYFLPMRGSRRTET